MNFLRTLCSYIFRRKEKLTVGVSVRFPTQETPPKKVDEMREHEIPYPVDPKFPTGTGFLAWGTAWGSHYNERMEWVKGQKKMDNGVMMGQHDGLDILTPDRENVTMPLSGRVVEVGVNDLLGIHARVEFEKKFLNYESLECLCVFTMAHLSYVHPDIKKGDFVPKGILLGMTGHTGNVRSSGGGTGAHMHISLRDPDGRPMRIKLVTI